MSIINFNNTQGLIPGTGSGKIYITTGAASSEALYGPWTEEALDNWSWLNNFTSQERLSLVGATIGIIHTTNDDTTVTEYQLCLDSTLQEHNGLYWKLKQSNISKSDQFTNDELLTIKDGYTNSGYGLFKTISLPDNINEADLIPVQYCPADITIFSQNDATSPIAQRVLKSNYLYVLKSNILNVLLYKAGDGINIVNSAINIKHSKSDTGKYLKATNSGVQWVNLPNQDNPYVSSQSIAYDSDSKELSVRIGNSTAECGLMITNKGLSIFKPETSGYLYYDISKGFGWQNSGASSSSYTSTQPIYINGKDIELNYTDPFTIENNNLALNIGDGLKISENKLQIKPASHDELGGINASVILVKKGLLLATHELSNFDSYKEFDFQTSKDGESYDQSRGDIGFIGAECVIVKPEDDTLDQNKLYADLSTMIQVATPEGDYLRVYIAAEDGKGISKGQLFVKQPVVVVEESNKSLQLYLYSEYTTQDTAPDFLSQADTSDYNICVNRAMLQDNLVLVDMDETHSGIYNDVTAIIINTIAKSTTEKAKTIIVNVTSLYGCELTTYGHAIIKCPDAELAQKARTIKIPVGTYAISCNHGTGSDKLVITVEQYQQFSDLIS